MLAGSGVELLDTAAEIALTHHERFDGAGYPRGLAGEEIPLAGRIAAVADAFDALTTDRVYRAAVSVEHAVETLHAERGRHFDPRVVDAFLDAIDEAVEIRARFAAAAGGAAGAGPGGQADHAPGRRRDARDLPQPAAPLGRRGPDPERPHRRRASPLLAGGRPPARRRERRAPDRPPVEPPATPLPLLAEYLRTHGRQLAAAAAAAIYREGPPGWFASEPRARAPRLDRRRSARAARAAVYARALQATADLMQRAHLHAASLLERHAFLERFGQVCARTLVRTGAEREEIAGTRRLFAALQQGCSKPATRDPTSGPARRISRMLTAALAAAAAPADLGAGRLPAR